MYKPVVEQSEVPRCKWKRE